MILCSAPVCATPRWWNTPPSESSSPGSIILMRCCSVLWLMSLIPETLVQDTGQWSGSTVWRVPGLMVRITRTGEMRARSSLSIVSMIISCYEWDNFTTDHHNNKIIQASSQPLMWLWALLQLLLWDAAVLFYQILDLFPDGKISYLLIIEI